MSTVDVAALITLCAALASAIGDVIRQRSAQEITDKRGRPPRAFLVVGADQGLVRMWSS
jgi:hypothetical protein